MPKRKLTVERLHQVLEYRPAEGIFLWLVATGPRCRVGERAGSSGGLGYRTLMVDKVLYKEHRLVWFYVTKKWPKAFIDHIDRDSSNNKLANLREATPSQNGQNRLATVQNTSGFKGVNWHSGDLKWQARISVDSKRIFLGYFDTPEAANKAYLEAVRKLHTHRPLEVSNE